MDKLNFWRDRRFTVRRTAIFIGILGICVVAWAAANIMSSGPPAMLSWLGGDGAISDARLALLDSLNSAPSTDTANSGGSSDPQAVTYSANPTTGEMLGVLTIPALQQSFPVFEGTGSDELRRGVGHMAETAMPGESDNCVISGHRDTVFTELGKLKVGDQLVLETGTGVHTYAVQRIRIVDKDDLTVVVPSSRALLTVSTCYPFNFIGAAPERYVLSAELLVNATPAVATPEPGVARTSISPQLLR